MADRTADIARVVSRAWSDADYKSRLLRDPKAAMQEIGVEPPANADVKVLENTDSVIHLVVPQPPAGGLSTDDLDKIAAGGGAAITVTW